MPLELVRAKSGEALIDHHTQDTQQQPRVQRGLFKMIRQFSVAAEQTVLLCPCDAVLDLAFSFALI